VQVVKVTLRVVVHYNPRRFLKRTPGKIVFVMAVSWYVVYSAGAPGMASK